MKNEKSLSDIDEVINLPAGATAYYTITGYISPNFSDTEISNTASAVYPDDNTSGNNNSTITTSLSPSVPVIGLAKNLDNLVNNADGTYTMTFTMTVENFGNSSLTNLILTDDVAGQFAGMSPTGFTVTNGSLAGNSSWNGEAYSNILSFGQSLAPKTLGTVVISFTVTPGAITDLTNQAEVTGTSPLGVTVSDLSTDGLDADRDGDNANGSVDDDFDPNEEVATPIYFGPLCEANAGGMTLD